MRPSSRPRLAKAADEVHFPIWGFIQQNARLKTNFRGGVPQTHSIINVGPHCLQHKYKHKPKWKNFGVQLVSRWASHLNGHSRLSDSVRSSPRQCALKMANNCELSCVNNFLLWLIGLTSSGNLGGPIAFILAILASVAAVIAGLWMAWNLAR